MKFTLNIGLYLTQGIKDLLPFAGSDGVDIEDLAPCGGCVVQSGVSKVAVYKDEKGCVHKFSGTYVFLRGTHFPTDLLIDTNKDHVHSRGLTVLKLSKNIL